MSIERDVLKRLTALEADNGESHRSLARANARIDAAEKHIEGLNIWRSYCDRLALKWGSFLMGVLALGAVISMGLEKTKDKILTWLFQ